MSNVTVKHIEFEASHEDDIQARKEGFYDGLRVQAIIYAKGKEVLRVSTFGDWRVRHKQRAIGIHDAIYETALMVPNGYDEDGYDSPLIEVWCRLHKDELPGELEADYQKARQMHSRVISEEMAKIEDMVNHGVTPENIITGYLRVLSH